MRKNYIANLIWALLLVVVFISCGERQKVHTEHGTNALVIDSSVAALVKPVNQRIIADVPAFTPESGSRIFSIEINGRVNFDTRKQTGIASRVGGRIERLYIKYNFQPVRRGQLIMEIYSPDLAAAQRELLYITNAGDDEVMFARAKQKLRLLGMRDADINRVITAGEIIYNVPVYSNTDGYIIDNAAVNSVLPTPQNNATVAGDGMNGMVGAATSPTTPSAPASTAPSPLLIREGQYVSAGQTLFTIYHADGAIGEFALPADIATRVQKGHKLLLYTSGNKEQLQSATVGLIEPVFRNGQRFSIARVYLDESRYAIGQLLTANIALMYNGGWWVPRKSVWKLGTTTIVFKKESNSFRPVKVETGAQVSDMVQVLTDMSGWNIATHAAYLVDSESFIDINNSIE